jgi:hypothetical protein
MKQYIVGIIIGLFGLIPLNLKTESESIFPEEAISVTPYLIMPPTSMPPTTMPTTTTTIAEPIKTCEQVEQLMIETGFESSDIPTALRIIYRESRCLESALNTTLNRDKSWDYGLAQINDRTWCKGSRFDGTGYLQSKGIINSCDDLLDPRINLVAMLELMRYSKHSSGCSFTPWRAC